MLDFVGRDGYGDARQRERRGRRACHREPVEGGGHVGLLPRLAGRQQHDFGQPQHVGEAPRQCEMPAMDRIERAAEQADAPRQQGGRRERRAVVVRIQLTVLCSFMSAAG